MRRARSDGARLQRVIVIFPQYGGSGWDSGDKLPLMFRDARLRGVVLYSGVGSDGHFTFVKIDERGEVRLLDGD